MERKLAWGIIGTGRIAGIFAKALADSKTGYVVAVGSRTQESADRFGNEHNIPNRYEGYENLLADPQVEAVYISTPHPMHAEWAVKAAEAGKHILLEKPFTLNYPEAMAVVDAARQHDVFITEAFMYRYHPQIARMLELIREGALGDVKLIQASFSFHAGYDPNWRLFNHALAGGGIMDVGCYTVSMARLIAGVALGKPFANPLDVKGSGHLGETGVDEYAVAILKFPGDIIAQVSCGVRLAQENVVRIFGTGGNLVLPTPWWGKRNNEPTAMVLTRNGEAPQEILIDNIGSLYMVEADIMARNIDKREAPAPALSCDDSLGNMRTLDQWRAAVGMVYEMEKPTANIPTIDRRPLVPRSGHNMLYGSVDGLNKPVSRLVMGAVGGTQLPFASVMYDEFYRCGGNSFDTAYIYGNSDSILGQWISNRGIREQVVILAKGAHTPNCDPVSLTQQLFESLERLQTDYADLYLMHRDNPEIPVGEFIEVLNEHVSAGRIRAFGASNWTLERVQEANDYAKSKGLTGFSAVSNNFSLARMVEAPWAGCLSSSDPESREWFRKNRMPLMAWSSTARGFFALGNPEDLSNKDLVRCWYSEDNFQRLERVKELASKRGVEPIEIAMAYVLCQPFPTFALFGPSNLDEMRAALKALSLTLTPDEMRWVNLEAGSRNV